jgi:hypothetical protein
MKMDHRFVTTVERAIQHGDESMTAARATFDLRRR